MNGTCEADSGSMTDCQPICDAKATKVVSWYGYGGRYVSELCDRHARSEAGRLWPVVPTITPKA